VHNMCLLRPALLYLNVHVLKVFYEQINYYYLMASKTRKRLTAAEVHGIQLVERAVTLWYNKLRTPWSNASHQCAAAHCPYRFRPGLYLLSTDTLPPMPVH